MDLTEITLGVMTIIIGIITKFLLPWIQVNTSKAQQEKLQTASEILVYSAERMFGASEGAKKLTYVEDLLAQQGYKMDTETIRAAIESAVEKLPQNAKRRLDSGAANEIAIEEIIGEIADPIL
jgi:type II secretory pathway pseudopilin PulG